MRNKVYIQRNLEQKLLEWKDRTRRMPIILKGARQVGKTSLVDHFGSSNFKQYIKINFEKERKFIDCFQDLDPKKIVSKIELMYGGRIDISNTLLFLDEIQECPQAILALRYFKEEMPELAVISAGSLLEFTLNQENFRAPVGRVKYLTLRPLSFSEFLIAIGKEHLNSYLSQVDLNNPPDSIAHQELLDLVAQYFVIGGMPEVVLEYIEKNSIISCQEYQKDLLNTYRNDFGKYSSHSNIKYLQEIYSKAPGLVGNTFKYSKISREMQSRELKVALNDLVDANIINKVYSTSASGLPLATTVNEKKFKITFVDIGLTQRACGIDSREFINKENVLLNKGLLAEQYVGQELLNLEFTDDQLYYWDRDKKNSQSEVDYVIAIDGIIYPIEVKSGVTGRLKSINIFMDEKNSNIGIRISQKPLNIENNIISVPFYLVSHLSRLILEI